MQQNERTWPLAECPEDEFRELLGDLSDEALREFTERLEALIADEAQWRFWNAGE